MITASETRTVTREDVRAALYGMALAAHASGSEGAVRLLAAAASRLAGDQTADEAGFARLIEDVVQLESLGVSITPHDIDDEYGNSSSDYEIIRARLQDDVDEALDQFGA